MKYRLSLDELKLKYNRLVGKTVFSKETMHGHIEEFLYPVLLVNETMDLQAMLDGQIEEAMNYEVFLQALYQCGFDTMNIVKPFDWSHIRRVLSKVPLNDDDDFWFFFPCFSWSNFIHKSKQHSENGNGSLYTEKGCFI